MKELKSMEIDEETPIFIAGSKRGGTTLLRRIIDAHSSVNIPPPDWIYHTTYPHLNSYGSLKRERNTLKLIKDILKIPYILQYWDVEETARDIYSMLPEYSFRGVVATLFRLQASKKDTSIWGSKVPNNGFWLKEIQKDFPLAKFILLYRDGRDVSFEMISAPRTGWPNNLYVACQWWRSYTRVMMMGRELLGANSYHEARYEDLVREPEKTVKSICEFLELEYEADMLKYYEREADEFLKRPGHEKTHKPITQKYVGVYKKLPLTDRRLQVAVMGSILKDLGYNVEDEPRTIDFWERERYLEEQRSTSRALADYKRELATKRVKRRRVLN